MSIIRFLHLISLSIILTAVTAYGDYPIDLFRKGNVNPRIGIGTDRETWRGFPAAQRNFHGITFFSPTSTEKSFVLLGGGKFGKVRIKLPDPQQGRYLYLLHATVGSIPDGTRIGRVTAESATAEFVDRERISTDIVYGREAADYHLADALPNGLIAWNSPAPRTGTLYLSRLDLAGRKINSIDFQCDADCGWLLAGAALSNALVGHTSNTGRKIEAGPEYLPLESTSDPILPGSILDLSCLLDPPAGKYGFLRSNADGMFEFSGKPGVPVRFYGANVRGTVPRAEIPAFVANFASVGYNLMRLHHFDYALTYKNGNSSMNIRKKLLDDLDLLIAECKKRGIYLSLDLYTLRVPVRGEIAGLENWTSYITAGEYKALIFIHPPAMENFKTFARKLMQHVNPYTGLAWNREPAVAFLSLINENTIYAVSGSSSRVAAMYERKFQEYLSQNNLHCNTENRPMHYRRFLRDTYDKAWHSLKNLVRELQIPIPVTDQNFWGTIPVVLQRNRYYDYTDYHLYWQHPVMLGGNYQKPTRVHNGSAIAEYGGTLLQAAVPRLYAKPCVISEWDFVNPNSANIEGAFLAGAYGALQNWSAMCRYEYPASLEKATAPLTVFALDPVRRLEERAGALFFLREDISRSKINYPILLPANALDTIPEDHYPEELRRLALLGGIGTVVTSTEVLPKLPPNSIAAISLGGKRPHGLPVYSGTDFVKKLKLDRPVFTSDTGELSMDISARTFTATSRVSEGFVLSPGRSRRGKFAKASNFGSSFTSILVAAMDGCPLQDSRRLLLLHLSDCKNSGMVFREPEQFTVEQWGTLPILARRSRGELILNRNFSGYRLYAVGFDGKRLFKLPLQTEGNRTRIELNTDHDGQAVFAYELTNMEKQ